MSNRKFLLFLIPCLFMLSGGFAQKIAVEFNEANWDLSRAKVVEHMGRQALIGTAYLKDITLASGIIEVDIATTSRTRSYPGVLFRMKDQKNCERIYLRPHRSPFYEDALQYTAMFNGVDSWQLYNGNGKTAAIDILPDKWNRLKIVVSGTIAKVYWNGSSKPALVIPDLDHGNTSGLLGLMGPLDGTAYYSEFTYEKSETPYSIIATPKVATPGAISEWELSEPFPLQYADFTTYPLKQIDITNTWQNVKADQSGVVDISRYYPRKYGAGDCIIARTLLKVDSDTLFRVGFGYSDYITVFLNGRPVYFGGSAYTSRDKSFLGVMGYFDNLFLPLSKGENELLVQVGESSGGWAFCFRSENEIFVHPSLKKIWTLQGQLAMPESAVYNPDKKEIYVANYYNEGSEFISRVSTDGKILEREWIKGLSRPTGMVINGNTLYAVDRTGLNLIDIEKGEVIEKIPLTGMRAPNDVAIDEEGTIYISDFPANAVYRYKNQVLEKWVENLENPNALFYYKGKILVGQHEALLSIDIKSKEIKTLANFEPGSNIDGVEMIDNKGFLLTDFFGKLYFLPFHGEKLLLLNTSTVGTQLADFCFITGKNMMIIPALNENSVICYSINFKEIK